MLVSGGHLVIAASGGSPAVSPQAVQGAMTLLYLVSRQKRFLAASVLVFSPQQVTFRLLWALTHYTQVCGTRLLAATPDSGCELCFVDLET